MEDSAILAALKGGKTSELFLVLAAVADELFIAHDASDTKTIGAVRIGSMTIGLDSDHGMTVHGHDDAEGAAHCLATNKARVTVITGLVGGRMVPDEETRALVGAMQQPSQPGAPQGVPDAMLMVDGQPAAAYIV